MESVKTAALNRRRKRLSWAETEYFSIYSLISIRTILFSSSNSDAANQIQIAQREGDYEKAAELSYGKMPSLKQQLEIEEEKVRHQELSLVHESVSVHPVLSAWNPVPF